MFQSINSSTKSIKIISKNTKSVFYYISFAFIVIMYFIFFNANSILPDDSTVINTSLGKETDVGSTQLAIKRWEYNKAKNFMEIELYYNNSSDYIETKLDFSAKAKSNVNKKLPVKIMITTDNTYIIHIENIPQNYKAIALKVSQNSNKSIDISDITTADFSQSIIDNNININNDNTVQKDTATLYCDYRKVKINNNIKVEIQKYYMINITKTEINNIENNIVLINNKIKANKDFISMTNKKINSLKDQYQYEIQEEQNDTTQKINSYSSKINEMNQKNNDLENTKSSLREKTKKLQQKVKDIINK